MLTTSKCSLKVEELGFTSLSWAVGWVETQCEITFQDLGMGPGSCLGQLKEAGHRGKEGGWWGVSR